MSSYLTRREIENIRSNLEKAIQKSIGNIDVHQVRNIIENCLYNGSDKKRTIEKLNELLDSKRAGRLYDKIQDLLEELNAHSNSKAKKRTSDNIEPNGNGNNINNYDNEEKTVKKQKITTSSFVDTKSLENINKMLTNTESEYKSENPTLVAAMTELQFLPSNSSTDANTNNSLTTQQIKAMMANAQREIEERKRALSLLKTKDSILSTTNVATSSGGTSSALPAAQLAAQKIKLPINPEDAERVKKIAELQAQIRAKLSGTLSAIIQPAIQDKPKPLILDEEGRTVDKSGRAISIPTLAPTLKANIRAKKKEIFNKNVQQMEKPYEEEGLTFFDDRINAKSAIRTKRILRFHEPGKFQQMAERMRMKAQLEKLQNEISQIARKTGISSATKLALIAPKQDSHSDDVPQMEWWDSVILVNDLNTLNDNNKIAIRESAITNLIEHPTQIKPPNELLKPVYLPVFLTRKERKKLRRQNRREAWKEEQEKIRIGLAPPPEPKLRISNLMRVLGTEAVQDPTKIEQHVREQMAKRQKAHEDANNARKLTVEQKRDKKIRKVREDTSGGVHVSVYRIRELQENQSKKYKVETNAKQLLMTGIVVLFRDCCVVVVEGGPKQQKRYKRLMLHRIKWEEDMAKNADGNEISNSCVLVWEGTSQRRHFGEIKFKIFPMEKMAREFFQKHQVEHYWDLAYSGAVLEASEDV